MKLQWNELKSQRLKRTRGASFEDILESKLLSVQRHQSRENQEMMLFERAGYIWVVPFVRSAEGLFLKTLYPSRYWTRKWKERKL